MIVTRAVLRGREGLWNIHVENGLISAITSSAEAGLCEGDYDAAGKLVCSPFVENHIHLDYANTAGVPRINQSGTLFEAIEIWGERKKAGLNNHDEIKRNAYAAARSAVSFGVGFVRSHVDVTDPDLIALKALLELKKEIADWCNLQIVAFPQNGIIAFPQGRDLMKKAMDMGADVVGGIPHLEPTREDGVESVKFIFDLAQEHNALVDIHCDEIDDSHSRFLEVMAAETVKRRMHGRVTASHVVAMAYYSPAYMARLLPKLVAAGIGFAVCPNENLQLQGRGLSAPIPRGVAPVRTLADAGLRVAFGQDSIEDPWYPMGVGNPLRNLDAGLHVCHMLSGDYLASCLDFVTTNPAHNLQLYPAYGLEKGKPANFIVLDCQTEKEAVQRQASVLLFVLEGRELFRVQPAVINWCI